MLEFWPCPALLSIPKHSFKFLHSIRLKISTDVPLQPRNTKHTLPSFSADEQPWSCQQREQSFKLPGGWNPNWSSAQQQSPTKLVRQPGSHEKNELVVNACSHEQASIMLRGRCETVPATFLLDTGSAVSLVSSSYLKQLATNRTKDEDVLKILPCDAKLSSITNSKLSVHGEIELLVDILSTKTAFRFIVTDFTDFNFLLGLDYMTQSDLVLDFPNREVISPTGRTAMSTLPVVPNKRQSIRCAETVVLPPNSGCILKGAIPSDRVTQASSHQKHYQGSVTPNPNLPIRKGVIVASALVITDGRNLPVKCINLSDDSVTIYKNQLLGNLEPTVMNNDTPSKVRRILASIMESDEELNIDQEAERVEIPEWTKDRLFSELNLENIDIPVADKDELKRVVWENRKCFSTSYLDVGECNMFKAHIDLKSEYTPQWIPSHTVPYKKRDEMNKKLAELQQSKIISRAETMSNWNSPVMLLPKPHNKAEYRFVADMRGLNSQVVSDSYELPNINHVTDKIAGAEWYSCLDFAQSFHQILLDDGSKPLTSFLCNGTRYWYNRLCMGFKNASSQFSRMMAKLINSCPLDLENLIYFLDDLLLWTMGIGSHIRKLDLLFKCLIKSGLKLAPSKCSLLKKQVSWVGISISKDGLSITKDRAQAVLDLQAPTNKKKLQQALGFLSYNRRFVFQYAELSHCLYKLLGKDSKWIWTEECQRNFDELKTRVASAPALAIPDLSPTAEEFEIEVDGSNKAIGGILYQKQDGIRRTVAYYSKSLPPHKRKWGQTKIEFTALCAAIKHWEIFLKGQKHFSAKTDCLSITNLDTIFKRDSPLLYRQLEALADYNFSIEHIAGKDNFQADFLSRYNFQNNGNECHYTCRNCGHRGLHEYNELVVSNIRSTNSATSTTGLEQHAAQQIDSISNQSHSQDSADNGPISTQDLFLVDTHRVLDESACSAKSERSLDNCETSCDANQMSGNAVYANGVAVNCSARDVLPYQSHESTGVSDSADTSISPDPITATVRSEATSTNSAIACISAPSSPDKIARHGTNSATAMRDNRANIDGTMSSIV